MKISVLVFVVLFELVYSRSMPGPTSKYIKWLTSKHDAQLHIVYTHRKIFWSTRSKNAKTTSAKRIDRFSQILKDPLLGRSLFYERVKSFRILIALVYSAGNVTVAAMTTSQKCKDMFHECTETKECCGVDVQCAQYGARKFDASFYHDIWSLLLNFCKIVRVVIKAYFRESKTKFKNIVSLTCFLNADRPGCNMYHFPNSFVVVFNHVV